MAHPHGQTATVGAIMGMDTASTSSLGYGKQITVGPFRCSSASAGITCVVITSGTGFMINASRVVKVGP